MERVIEPAYAKINLLLQIVGKRIDGYHLLDGVMQTVSLRDTVTVAFEPATESTICLTAEGNPAMPTDERNLAYRAAEALLNATEKTGRVQIHIEKHIPMAGGLAGGSTDAAATLRALDRLLGTPASMEELCEIGAKLGADVPFCIRGGAMRTQGIGEKLTPCAGLPSCHLVIACAGEGVSTPAAYKELDRRYGDFQDPTPKDRETEALMQALQAGDLSVICGRMENLFEEIVPEHNAYVGIIRQTLLECGAVGAMMSGSGPSVFGIFKTVRDAEAGCAALEKIGISGSVCEPIGREFSLC